MVCGETPAELAHDLHSLVVAGEAVRDAAEGVVDGRVVASAEGASDRWQGLIGEVADERHRHLTGPVDRRAPAGGGELIDGDAELGGDRGLDRLDRQRSGARVPARPAGYIASRTSLVRGTSIARCVSEWNATTRISAPSSRRMLSRDAVGDQVENCRVGEFDPIQRGALAEDRDPRGVVGRLDVGDQARLEALA